MSTKDTNSNPEYKIPDDWRGEAITRIRKLIKEADPEAIEDVKWKTPTNPNGVLVWYHDGMLLTGGVYKKHLRLSFAKGPALKKWDAGELINSYRAIILHEEDSLDGLSFEKLIKAAVKLNQEGKKKE